MRSITASRIRCLALILGQKVEEVERSNVSHGTLIGGLLQD